MRIQVIIGVLALGMAAVTPAGAASGDKNEQKLLSPAVACKEINERRAFEIGRFNETVALKAFLEEREKKDSPPAEPESLMGALKLLMDELMEKKRTPASVERNIQKTVVQLMPWAQLYFYLDCDKALGRSK